MAGHTAVGQGSHRHTNENMQEWSAADLDKNIFLAIAWSNGAFPSFTSLSFMNLTETIQGLSNALFFSDILTFHPRMILGVAHLRFIIPTGF